jgi:catechol 2,3-dioxygenase-like lactoylglutathione lyase family enzyme
MDFNGSLGGISMNTHVPGQMPSFLKSGITQVAMIVRNLDQTIENYWVDLGIGPWSIYTYGKPLVRQMSYHGQQSDYKMRMAIASLGQMQLELIEILEGDTIYADYVKDHGYGIHHIQFLVDNVQSALAEVEAAGFKVIQDGSGFGMDGDGYFGYLDTEEKFGVTIELVSRPKTRVEPEKIYPAKQR